MEILGKLFGSPARVKVMKLFLANEEIPFDNEDISKRAKVPMTTLRKELNLLLKVGLIKKKVFYKEVEKKIKKTKTKPARVEKIKKKTNGWILNDKFIYLMPLYNLLVGTSSFTPKIINKRLVGVGRLKLVLISGVLLKNSESRVDLLVVGDGIKTSSLEKAIKTMESEIGKELKYAAFETNDFIYRLNIYDRLVRDIIDHPHQKIVNKIGV